MFTTSINEEISTNFKIACTNEGKRFSHILEVLMILYTQNIFSKVDFPYKKYVKREDEESVQYPIVLPQSVVRILNQHPHFKEPIRHKFIEIAQNYEKDLRERIKKEMEKINAN